VREEAVREEAVRELRKDQPCFYLYRFENITMGNSICCARSPGFAATINPERLARNILIPEPIVNVNHCEKPARAPSRG
jgi:hypothetical protein